MRHLPIFPLLLATVSRTLCEPSVPEPTPDLEPTTTITIPLGVDRGWQVFPPDQSFDDFPAAELARLELMARSMDLDARSGSHVNILPFHCDNDDGKQRSRTLRGLKG
jgi:hypothetical protein